MRDRLTYANVIATLALFIALGGSSYAALNLPKRSVGTQQLRTGAVASRAVADRSLELRDISRAARARLSGKQGVTGPQGPAGPAGKAAIQYFAAVTASGSFSRGNANSGGRTTIGSYTVGFPAPVSACGFTATLGSTDGSDVPAGRVTVTEVAGKVAVKTYDVAGTAADLPFHLVVVC